jgi:hypothetical protein
VKITKVVKVERETDAWSLGADDFECKKGTALRIKGGRALYDAAWTDGQHAGSPGYLDGVRLSRLGPDLKPVMRWVPGTTILEVVLVEEQ